MLRAFVFALSILIPALAQADLARDANELAREVQAQAPRLSRAQEQRISAYFAAIRDVLRDREGDRPSDPAYFCTARDNDNRAPWVIGYRDFAELKKVQGTQFSDYNECVAALKESRSVGERTLLCASRDNDGRNPFLIGMIDGEGKLTKLQRSGAQDVSACYAAVRDLRVQRQGILYCGSRDNDGRNPF